MSLPGRYVGHLGRVVHLTGLSQLHRRSVVGSRTYRPPSDRGRPCFDHVDLHGNRGGHLEAWLVLVL
ncbi:ORFS342C.iORF1 [Human betaherpesvirus 5]|nr:ORFS342C.iORF1 [Human betaherpesvirus 5]QHX40703.1 ORFS342C.iORF1 [Human betaherpesvirus 5]